MRRWRTLGAARPSLRELSQPLLSTPEECNSSLQFKRDRDIWEEADTERGVFIRYLAMLINTLASLAFSIATLQEGWDGHHYRNNSTTYGLSSIVSALTALLFIQQVELHFHKLLRTAALVPGDDLQLWDERRVLKMPTWVALWNEWSLTRHAGFIFQLLVCVPHPAPGLPGSLTKVGAMFMFIRLFFALNVLQHLSPIYRDKHLIKRIPGYARVQIPRVTSWFTTRSYYHKYPISFILIGMAYLLLTSSYGIYIYERERQPEDFSYKLCFVMAIENLLIGWPGDVFSMHTPRTNGARAFTTIASVGGLFFFALLITYLYKMMSLSASDGRVVDWIERIKLEDKERQVAAKLIQLVWRKHRRNQKRAGDSYYYSKFGLFSFSKSTNFYVQFIILTRKVRSIRRKLNELYGRTGDSLGGRYCRLQEKQQSDSKDIKELKTITWVKHATEEEVASEAKDRQDRLEKYLEKAARNVQKLLTEIQLAREELVSLQQNERSLKDKK